ncbi:inner membrane protein [Roseateles sp. YR242]|uniref:cell envelope integrity protein CreD n=1 Tax=Roseateles sp. YR242 TaxID=1855305 RepID=UPI0008ABDE05|nr:cell envelope integrity protein CreD [Roseateles sp. YR242]SEL76585.1 inner membrane protein [Roseateles sp. YR242]
MKTKALWVKLAILAAVTLLLLVVLARIGWLVDERQQRQREAADNVAASQAGEQMLLGPMLSRWCVENWEETQGTGKDLRVERQRREFTLMQFPVRLNVDGELNQETRYRSLFKVRGYAGRVALKAHFADLAGLVPVAEHKDGVLTCSDPQMVVSVSDPRGLQAVEIRRGEEALTVVSGTTNSAYPRGLHAALRGQALDQPLDLAVTLQLTGTTRFAVVPAASATDVTLRSNWPHPSFGGRFLPSPATRTIDANGFSAQWTVSELATDAMTDVLKGNKQPDSLDFSMVDPVNPYVMSDRAIKYGLMFIVLTFVCVGMLELLAGRRVHPVQYLLVGLAISLFFLLLLSLSEHLSFAGSYGAAAAAVVLLLGYYGAAMLGQTSRGLGFGTLVALLYGALYVVLIQEQAALLIGALLLFSVLTIVMVLTRRIDWYALQGSLDASATRKPAAASRTSGTTPLPDWTP